MFFVLIVNVSSADVFIPMSKISGTYCTEVDSDKLNEYISKNEKLIVLSSPSTLYKTKEYLNRFSNINLLYDKNVPFLFIDNYKNNMFRSYGTTSILFYRNGTIYLTFPFPDNDMSLLFAIKSFTDDKFETVNSVDQLIPKLGSYKYTFITKEDNLDKTIELRRNVSSTYGPIDILIGSKRFLMGYGVDIGDFLLFRLDDQSLVPVVLSDESFLENCQPVFHRFRREDLNDPNSIYVGIVDNDISLAQEEYLYDIAEQYPDFKVGFFSPELRDVIEDTLLYTFKTPDIVAFNPVYRYYYPTDSFQGYALLYPFSRKDYNEQYGPYFEQVFNGSLKKRYHYVNVSVVSRYKNLSKLNSKSYLDFITNKKKDSIIFYTTAQKGFLSEIKTLKKIANLYAKRGIDDVQFGYINRKNNTGHFLFPKNYSDVHIVYFVRGNINEPIHFMHTFNRDDITRFISYCAPNKTGKLRIRTKPKDVDEFKDDIERFVNKMYDMTNIERKKLVDYFKYSAKRLKMDEILEKYNIDDVSHSI